MQTGVAAPGLLFAEDGTLDRCRRRAGSASPAFLRRGGSLAAMGVSPRADMAHRCAAAFAVPPWPASCTEPRGTQFLAVMPVKRRRPSQSTGNDNSPTRDTGGVGAVSKSRCCSYALLLVSLAMNLPKRTNGTASATKKISVSIIMIDSLKSALVTIESSLTCENITTLMNLGLIGYHDRLLGLNTHRYCVYM